MSENLPLAAGMAQTRAIRSRAASAIARVLDVLSHDSVTSALDPSIVKQEVVFAMRAWLAQVDPHQYADRDICDMDSGPLQALAMQIDLELEARGYSVIRSVCPPEPTEDHERFAIGTQPGIEKP